MLYRGITKIVLCCSVLVGFNSCLIAGNGTGIYSNENATLNIDTSGKVSIEYGDEFCTGELIGSIVNSNGNILRVKPLENKTSSCIITINLESQSLNVNETNCDYFHGDNCNFNGSYFLQSNTLSNSKELTWQDLGIGVTNPGEIKDWTYFGTKTPKEAAEWIDALKPLGGISFSGATRAWKQNGFEAKEVKEWIRLGARNPREANEWIEAGAHNTQEVHQWINIGINSPNELFSWTYNNIKTPERVYAWLEVGVKNTADLKGWWKAGIYSPEKVQEWKNIGMKDYNEIYKWKKLGVEKPLEVKRWIDAGINDSNVVEAWKSINVHTLDEMQTWKSIGISDVDTCREWKRYVKTPEEAKEWMDASYTLSDVASHVSNGNLSPTDVKSSYVKNIFWLIILAITGIFVYRALQLKCPECKSKNYTEIDSKEDLIGYERYSKNGDNYTKIKGLHNTRGKHTKVNAIYDVQKTYRCDDCGHVFIKRTKNSESV